MKRKLYFIVSSSVMMALTALLTACPSYQHGTPQTTTSSPLPTGERVALGTQHQPNNSPASYLAVAHQSLPQWSEQNFPAALNAFILGCDKLKHQTNWQNVCRQAMQTAKTSAAAQSFFERYFTAWQVSEQGKLNGLATGYYEPVLLGDSKPTAQARFPIYGVPSDLVSVALPNEWRNSKETIHIQAISNNSGKIQADGNYVANLADFPIKDNTRVLKGRFEANRFVPYHTRNEINGGALDHKAPILAWANDPVELFFLHIQGSGRIQTPDGKFIRLGFADKNEYPYVSIGRYMADKGYLPLAQTTMQGIKAYMQQHPERLAEVLGQNPSYVFFRSLDGHLGPIGALGTPLSDGYSAAVDRRYITLGAPLFVATTHPETRHAHNRLLMAQDTGSAIKGAVRIDYFWGYGEEAGRVAGKMKETAYVWLLLPNGVLPQYQP